MNQRVFYGNINPTNLADHLVGVFNQQPGMYYNHPHTMAQRVGEGDSVLVQILHSGSWGRNNNTLGVQIVRVPGGVSVSIGQSNWLDIDESTLAGMVVGALFFPPLLLFPLISGLTHSSFDQDVWSVIEGYCTWAAGQTRGTEAPRVFHCPYCGAYNQIGAQRCLSCNGWFHYSSSYPSPEEPPSPSAKTAAVPETQATQEPVSTVSKTPVSPAAEVVCPNCGATVSAANFCGNCAAPLREVISPEE